MTTWIALSVISVVLCALVGWLVPAWAAKRIVAAQEASDGGVPNFRGSRVVFGLGLVWAVWAVGVAAVSNLVGFGAQLVTAAIQGANGVPEDWLGSVSFSPLATATRVLPILLVIGAVAFGLADDVLGAGADKGFAGHIRALREGRLTTGMLKLLGIGLLAFVTATGIAASIDTTDAMVAGTTGWTHAFYVVLTWVAATLVIALASNLLNLTDLRPGRSLKVYTLLAIPGIGLSMWGAWGALQRSIITSAASAAVNGDSAATVGLPAGAQLWVWGGGVLVCLALVCLGPMAAVWKHDLGEHAMLGDAGANAMGVTVGYLLARSAPLWLLGVFTLVLLALNLVSEKVSFTSVIEKVGVLRWLDGIGRIE